jgi:hypothetical protein
MSQDNDDRMPAPRLPDQGGPERVEYLRPPRDSFEPQASEFAPPSKPAASAATIWAGVTVAAMVIVAAVVVALVVINHNGRKPAGAIAHSSTAPASKSLPPTVVSSAPTASALPAGLASFAREWRGMRETIVIDLAGHGRFHYMMACATCSMAEMPYNTMDFTITSVSDGAASGSVTASSDPQHPIGEPVAATLGPQDTIRWTLGGKNVGLFCGSNPAWCGG